MSDDLEQLGRGGAVEAMRAHLVASAQGRTHTPPRLRVPLGDRTLVYTVGASEQQDVAGFRMYSIGSATPPALAPTQLVVALRHSTGEVLAVGAGDDFGAWRTAALGAVAMVVATKHIDRPIRMGLLGAGYQAFHHARTWIAARPIAEVVVWARRPEAAAAFAAQLSTDTGVACSSRPSAEEAVDGVDAVLGVTRSGEPVVAEEALPATLYAATVGPKFGGRHELPAALYASATLFSDAPAQCAAFEQTVGPMPGGRTAAELVDLAQLVVGAASLPIEGRRLFVSEGLAGTEVALLVALLEAAG